MFWQAAKAPFLSFKKLLIGSAVSSIPILNLILFGYTLACAENSARGLRELPTWKQSWPRLFAVGLGFFVLMLIYFAPSLAVLYIGGLFLHPLLALGIAAVLFVLASYSLPIAVLEWHFQPKLLNAAAFNLGSIAAKAFRFSYFKIWLLTIFYAILVLSLGVFLSAIFAISIYSIPFSLLINGMAEYITLVTMYSAYGEVYARL